MPSELVNSKLTKMTSYSMVKICSGGNRDNKLIHYLYCNKINENELQLKLFSLKRTPTFDCALNEGQLKRCAKKLGRDVEAYRLSIYRALDLEEGEEEFKFKINNEHFPASLSLQISEVDGQDSIRFIELKFENTNENNDVYEIFDGIIADWNEMGKKLIESQKENEDLKRKNSKLKVILKGQTKEELMEEIECLQLFGKMLKAKTEKLEEIEDVDDDCDDEKVNLKKEPIKFPETVTQCGDSVVFPVTLLDSSIQVREHRMKPAMSSDSESEKIYIGVPSSEETTKDKSKLTEKEEIEENDECDIIIDDTVESSTNVQFVNDESYITPTKLNGKKKEDDVVIEDEDDDIIIDDDEIQPTKKLLRLNLRKSYGKRIKSATITRSMARAQKYQRRSNNKPKIHTVIDNDDDEEMRIEEGDVYYNSYGANDVDDLEERF
ncbi:hypothetical protein SNEBB_006033 [Seison nebaliae]|nr:hypothetical protein SNEBB_006033 [Seison nebaliae]